MFLHAKCNVAKFDDPAQRDPLACEETLARFQMFSKGSCAPSKTLGAGIPMPGKQGLTLWLAPLFYARVLGVLDLLVAPS